MFTETIVKYEEEPILERVIQFCTVGQVNWKIKFPYCLQSRGFAKAFIGFCEQVEGLCVCVCVCVFTTLHKRENKRKPIRTLYSKFLLNENIELYSLLRST